MSTTAGGTLRDRQILDAAAELFFERGFAATGVAAIGERVGISGPAIYSHFSSKDEILTTLALEALDRLFERIGQPTDDPRADLERLIRSHAEEVLRDRGLANVYVREGRSLAPAFEKLIRRRLDQYVERWVATLARCWPHHDRATLIAAASAAMGLTNSTVLWREEAFATPGLVDLVVSMSRAALVVLDELPLPA
jgi:AcrR family transcriptional regulator